MPALEVCIILHIITGQLHNHQNHTLGTRGPGGIGEEKERRRGPLVTRVENLTFMSSESELGISLVDKDYVKGTAT